MIMHCSLRFARELCCFRWARIGAVVFMYTISSVFLGLLLAVATNLSTSSVTYIIFFYFGIGSVIFINFLMKEYKSLFIDFCHDVSAIVKSKPEKPTESLKDLPIPADKRRLRRPRSFFTHTEQNNIIKAIKVVEAKTSCEIRLHIAQTLTDEPEKYAEKVFNKLKMCRTKRGNGCLIAIGLIDGRIKVFGDVTIRFKTVFDYLHETENIIKDSFNNREYTSGICKAIERIGVKLIEFFPYEDDINELSDKISF